MPLEKYEEDQSKYYLSYPKLLALEVKWENGNINFEEWANVAKFSKLDDIMTPVRLLKLFFEDVLVNLTFCYIKLYSYREKADLSFEITNENICLFLTILLLRGCYKLSDRKMYWEATLDTFVQKRSDSMPRITFKQILRNLHLYDNK